MLKRILGIIGLCMLGTGCSPISNLTHTMLIEPLQFCDFREEHRTHARHARRAENAWKDFQCDQRDEWFSPDFVRGFKEGFADYLDAGGTGEPPPIPPRRYWQTKFETARGHQSIQDWFAGFRQGAATAQESGWRHYATVPLSTPTDDQTSPERQGIENLPDVEPLPISAEPLATPPLADAGTSPGESPPRNDGDSPR